jgi:raffinose/stachyose/melibiose transport system substrate-binding protein
VRRTTDWRRSVRGTLALAMAVLATGAVGCSPSDSAEQAGSTRLTVWSWRTEDVAAYNRIFADYSRTHPGVTVEFKAYKNTEYNTILQTGLTESGGPDVAQLRAYGQLQPFVESGGLLPLDGKVDLAGFAPSVVDSAKGKKDGKLYGVPAAVQTMQVFYNKKIFAEQGIAVPTSWAQLTAAAAKLKAAGVTPFATTGKDNWMLPILHDTVAATRYGGAEFQAKVLAGKAKFTDPDYVASLQVVQSLQPYLPEDVVGISYTDAQLLFINERAAMFPGGSFELGFFAKQNPDLQIGTFAAPPAPGAVLGSPVTPGWADMSYGVNAKSAHQPQALELVAWMATEEFGQRFTDELKQISPVPGVTASDPLLAEMRQAYERSPAPYLMLVDFRYGQPTGTDLLAAGIQQMLLGKTDAAGVAGSVQKGLAQWFSPSGG